MPEVYEGSNVKVIKQYFYPSGASASEVMKEFRGLSDEDKQQLGDGIRNGTFTY